jgi:hydrogenase nickel incorporation protein HypB
MCATCGCAHATAHPPDEVSTPERNVLARNDQIASSNRERLASLGVRAINLMGSPGSGRTTLLERTIQDLGGRRSVTVIEGDQETALDAERIRRTGVDVVQVNTGAGGHLDASMLDRALDDLDPAPGSLLFVENVGNLVCPALLDLGEAARVVIVSVAEGTDKPLKYPYMFAAVDLVVINKVDLLPYVDFDLDACRLHVASVNPAAAVVTVSAARGDNLTDWYGWLFS